MDIQRMHDVNLIESFLATILGKEIAEALIARLGFFLTNDASNYYNKTYIFSGGPGSGKTTMFNLMSKLLGTDGLYEFIEDCDVNKLQITLNNKVRFIATNTPYNALTSELKTDQDISIFTMSENIWTYSKYAELIEAIDRSYVYFAAYCGAKCIK